MSYFFEFTAPRAKAIELVEAQGEYPHVDAGVVALIKSAIENVPDDGDGGEKLFHVKAQGHHCDGRGSYDQTTHNIEVKPLTVTR